MIRISDTVNHNNPDAYDCTYLQPDCAATPFSIVLPYFRSTYGTMKVSCAMLTVDMRCRWFDSQHDWQCQQVGGRVGYLQNKYALGWII